MKTTLVLLIALLAGGVVAVLPSDASADGEITGRVYEDKNDNAQYDPGVDEPLAGIEVLLSRIEPGGPVPLAITVTDANGEYQCPSVGAGTLRVQLISLPGGWSEMWSAVVVIDNQPVPVPPTTQPSSGPLPSTGGEPSPGTAEFPLSRSRP